MTDRDTECHLPLDIKVCAPGCFLIRDLVVDLKQEFHGEHARRSRRPAVILALEKGELLVAEDLVTALGEKSVEGISSHNIEKLIITIENRLLCVTFFEHIQASFDWTSCVSNT